MPPALSVIIVSWNTRDLLCQALDSVCATGDDDDDALEIIVVDNASSDGTPTLLQERYPHVKLIDLKENLGFAGGNNRGLAAAQGETILLLNSDTKVLPGALSALRQYLEDHPKVGLVGPKLLNGDGTTQSSRRRFPTLPLLFLESTWLQPLAPRRSLERFYMEDVPEATAHPVDWVTGAAMMVRTEVVRQVGGLDEDYFMYSEELDWCRRIREAGWEIAYTPAAEIIHYGGRSSDQVVPARHIYFQTSKVRYARKFHGRAVAELLRVWLLGQYLWQSALEGAKWLVGHRRELRAARLNAYWRVLRSGLRQP
ncbi:MAG: glycosyltransferase family 2 protein [Anaerolineae bacterium]|nr:glycosyltransferase family 2 protein [Anaerolineae bacterium]